MKQTFKILTDNKQSIKQFSALAFSLCIVFTIFSCGRTDSSISDKTRNTNNVNDTDNKILIVYFSRAGENYNVGHISVGNTAIIAGFIKDYTGAATFEIVPAIPYPDGYDKMKDVSQQETADNARPAIKNTLENLDKYSIVFVGSPIWYGAPPMIMRTFYETYREKLAGKTFVLFGTHEGSGVSSCTNLLREYFPNATLLETLGIRGKQVTNSRESVEEWLRRIGIPGKNKSKKVERK
jgi:flavodoxin